MYVLEDFTNAYDGTKWRADPYEMLLWCIRSDRNALLPLARWLVSNVEKPQNLISDLVCHLTEAEFTELVSLVAPTLVLFEPLENAKECIESAASQIPEALSPFLSVIGNTKDLYRVEFAWRAADPIERAALEHRIVSGADGDIVTKNWEMLLETRDIDAIMRVFGRFSAEDQKALAHYALERDILIDEQHATSMTHGPCHHLFFAGGLPSTDTGYVEAIRRLHPTARLRSEHDVAGLSGGVEKGGCSVCHQPVSVLLRLRGAPVGFSVRPGPLTLVACISCLSVDPSALYYSHENPLEPVSMAAEAGRKAADFFFSPLPVSRMRASPTPKRWQIQDGLNYRENLHRIGGRPSWIQYAEYPECPRCTRLMPFLAQLSSDLPAMPGEASGLTEDGLTFFFWCDDCQVSAVLSQYT
jgi:hypothetical protein